MADLKLDEITGDLVLEDINLEGSFRNEFFYTANMNSDTSFTMNPTLGGLSTFSVGFDVLTTASGVIYTEGSDNRFKVSNNGSFLSVTITDATGKLQPITVSNGITLGSWTSILITRSATLTSIYKDGIEIYSEPTVTGVLPTTTQVARIASEGSAGEIQGSIAFLSTYSTALSSSDATTLYSQGFGFPYLKRSTGIQSATISAWDLTVGFKALDQKTTNHLTEIGAVHYTASTRLQATALQQGIGSAVTKTLTLTDDLETIAQRVNIRLLFFLGEWVLDVNQGTPWYQRILKKNVTQDSVDIEIRSRILDTEGVRTILEFSSNLNNTTRLYSATFKLLTDSGELTGSLADGNVTIG